jgi:hypothetical protein
MMHGRGKSDSAAGRTPTIYFINAALFLLTRKLLGNDPR